MYVISELMNSIDVYSYREENDNPFFEKIQTVYTTDKHDAKDVAGSGLVVSNDGSLVAASNAGENSVALFKTTESGMLGFVFCLPISGEYPKDLVIFPDNKHLVSLNHESNTMTFFTIDVDKKTMIMNGKEMKVKQGNCIVFHKL